MLNKRVTVQFRFAIVASMLLIGFGLTGCKADSNYFKASNASIGSGDGASAGEAVGFRVRLKAKVGVDGFMHKFGNIATACEIPLTAIDTPTEINCMMNMLEYDLWFYGYEYEVNVPGPVAGKPFCEFLIETPHRYYKGQAGYGPSTVSITMTDGAMSTCSINGAAGTINAVQKTCSNAEATFSSSGSISSCAYDYSHREGNSKGPNCCQGTVDVNVTTISTIGAPPPPASNVSSKNDYGGSIQGCFESANDFIPTWPKLASPSIAVNLVTELGSGGLIRAQKLPSVFALGNQGTRIHTHADFLNAGFHGWDVYAADASAYSANVTVPKAMNPQFDLGAAGTHAGAGASALPQVGKGAVIFECLNGAGEVRHRINMYANAWNTIEDFQAFQRDGVAAVVDPNRTGTAGINCSAVNGLGSCNTIWGFDDMIKSNYPSELGCAGDPAAYCYPYEGSRPSPP